MDISPDIKPELKVARQRWMGSVGGRRL